MGKLFKQYKKFAAIALWAIQRALPAKTRDPELQRPEGSEARGGKRGRHDPKTDVVVPVVVRVVPVAEPAAARESDPAAKQQPG